MIGLVLCGALVGLFVLVAWKFRRGEWLFLISGNNHVTKEEMKTPLQRELGRRVSVSVLLCAAMCFGGVLLGVADLMSTGVLFAIGAVIVGACAVLLAIDVARTMAWSFRKHAEGQKRRLEDAAEQGASELKRAQEENRLDRMQQRVVAGIVVGLTVLCIVLWGLRAAA